MDSKIAISLQQPAALTIPMVTIWNRLEGRPRTDNFDRPFRAEVRDALFMITKQWQMGEYIGDDAGSPVASKIWMHTTELTKYQALQHDAAAFDEDIPLEAKVEKRPIPLANKRQLLSIDIRLQLGKRWVQLMKKIDIALADAFISTYGFTKPNPGIAADALLTAHKEVWQQLNAISGKSMDGGALLLYLQSNAANKAYGEVTTAVAGNEAAIEAATSNWLAWYKKLYYQPQSDQDNAWKKENLEYQFAASAPDETNEKVYVAEEYYQGHLDWYNLDTDAAKTALQIPDFVPLAGIEKAHKQAFIPTPIQFSGMPDTRWWKFENGLTNFGNINPGTTDIGKLLFIDFALVFANDWFVLPLTLPAKTIAKVKGLTVTNVFGETIWVEAAGKGLDDNWKKWSMYSTSVKGNAPQAADNSIILLPTVYKILEGKAIEAIHFLRDEVANMVWAIEKEIPLATGFSLHGKNAAIELKARLQKIIDNKVKDGLIPAKTETYKADIFYRLMNEVPEYWIPFIAAREENSKRKIKLQRAAMPRILVNDNEKAKKTEPRTSLLREGIDQLVADPYFIEEHEITRAGTQVYQSYQRARWYGGKVITWLGNRKQTGRGQGSSGLSFDDAVDVKKSGS